MTPFLKTGTLFLASAVAIACAVPCQGDEPIIPPSIATITPAGMQRGKKVAFAIEGRNLSDATQVIFDTPGMSGKVSEITDVPEELRKARAGEDLGAIVAVGKKQTAKLEISVANDVEPGIHNFRILTPLGTTNSMALAVGAFPETQIRTKTAADSAGPQSVTFPATLVGLIPSPGDQNSFRFDGRAGEEVVFRVEASELGSGLMSALALSDSSGKVLSQSAEQDNNPDAVLHVKLPQDGAYTLTLTDRESSGGMDHFYRLDAGVLPYIANVFPLGMRAGAPAKVAITGANLPSQEVSVNPPASAQGWTTVPLNENERSNHAINQIKLAIGNEPEILESEPNDSVAQAQSIAIPVTINGHIERPSKGGANPDEDFFKFHAAKGQRLSIDVAAARLGSRLDSAIEILDAQGNALPRATIRCLNQTTTTLSDRDSMTTGIRLTSTSGIHEKDYLMVGDELNQVDYVPDQPDADTILRGLDGRRLAYIGTSPDVHAVNTPVYKVQILPSDAEFPSNGLPVFHLTWRNDDGGPGYGADSMLDFVAPAEADYVLHLKDVRALDGPDFAYRLTIRDTAPDFRLMADPANPNIPKGGSTLVNISLAEVRNYDGPIEIEVKGLPPGVSASPATIEPGQTSTVVILSANSDARIGILATPIDIVGHANAAGLDLVRQVNADSPAERSLQLVSIIPPPDVVVTTEARQVSIEPGKDLTVTLHIDRQNGFKGRVPCSVQNLPPGVRVVNVGLNGVLVTETQSSRTFTLHAEEWARPITQPIYVVAMVESNSPTMHPSPSLQLNVTGSNETAAAAQGHAAESNQK